LGLPQTGKNEEGRGEARIGIKAPDDERKLVACRNK